MRGRRPPASRHTWDGSQVGFPGVFNDGIRRPGLARFAGSPQKPCSSESIRASSTATIFFCYSCYVALIFLVILPVPLWRYLSDTYPKRVIVHVLLTDLLKKRLCRRRLWRTPHLCPLPHHKYINPVRFPVVLPNFSRYAIF